MADPRALWRPDVGVVEVAGDPPGPAGVAAIEVDRVRYVVDAVEPNRLVRVGIDVDGWLHPQDRRLLAGLLGRVGDEVDAWTLDPTPREREVGLVSTAVAGRLARLAELAEVLAADPLSAPARAVARLDHADAALEAAALVPDLVEVARTGLWSVVTDPAAADLLDDVDRRQRATVAALVARVVGRTGDPDLDIALRDLGRLWEAPPPPPPDLVEPLPRPAAAPAMVARSSAAAAAPDASFAEESLAGAAGGGAAAPEPVERVGDELRVLVPGDAGPGDWVRVARRHGRVLLGAVPVAVARGGRVRVPVPAGLATDALVVDVVDDPALPVRDERGRAHDDAVSAGRRALSAERRGRAQVAIAAWTDCADAWAGADDLARADAASRLAAAPRRRPPHPHDAIA